jgi:hypothetical protein
MGLIHVGLWGGSAAAVVACLVRCVDVWVRGRVRVQEERARRDTLARLTASTPDSTIMSRRSASGGDVFFIMPHAARARADDESRLTHGRDEGGT